MATIIDNGIIRNGGRSPSVAEEFDFFPSGMEQNQSYTVDRDGTINSARITIEGTVERDPVQESSDQFVEATKTQAKASQTTADILKENQKRQLAVAGARFFANVMNAQSQYTAISEQARTNIFLANQSAADAIARGKQASLQLEQRGRQMGENAKLAAAAQGQDVKGAGVDKLVAGQESVGIYNAMIAEMNANREALGFEQEAIQYMGQIEQAEIQRNFSILSGALQFGASAIPLG